MCRHGTHKERAVSKGRTDLHEIESGVSSAVLRSPARQHTSHLRCQDTLMIQSAVGPLLFPDGIRCDIPSPGQVHPKGQRSDSVSTVGDAVGRPSSDAAAVIAARPLCIAVPQRKCLRHPPSALGDADRRARQGGAVRLFPKAYRRRGRLGRITIADINKRLPAKCHFRHGQRQAAVRQRRQGDPVGCSERHEFRQLLALRAGRRGQLRARHEQHPAQKAGQQGEDRPARGRHQIPRTPQQRPKRTPCKGSHDPYASTAVQIGMLRLPSRLLFLQQPRTDSCHEEVQAPVVTSRPHM
mmetsp:Transcript_9582/g.23938  ORF Transcript_9582/g.23938 Transcript_9582/m.23938 type:complete len:297 (-) Transcript_9582:115-1005(-)